MYLQLNLQTQKDSPEHNEHSSLQEFFRLNTLVTHSTIGVLQTANKRVPTLRTPENKEEPNSLADPVVQSKNERSTSNFTEALGELYILCHSKSQE